MNSIFIMVYKLHHLAYASLQISISATSESKVQQILPIFLLCMLLEEKNTDNYKEMLEGRVSTLIIWNSSVRVFILYVCIYICQY